MRIDAHIGACWRALVVSDHHVLKGHAFAGLLRGAHKAPSWRASCHIGANAPEGEVPCAQPVSAAQVPRHLAPILHNHISVQRSVAGVLLVRWVNEW